MIAVVAIIKSKVIFDVGFAAVAVAIFIVYQCLFSPAAFLCSILIFNSFQGLKRVTL